MFVTLKPFSDRIRRQAWSLAEAKVPTEVLNECLANLQK